MIEVRCCCQPQKLLGYVPGDIHRNRIGSSLIFHLSGPVNFLRPGSPEAAKQEVRRLVLPIREFSAGPRPGWAALSADGHSIEELRAIRGWVDAS